MLIREVVSSPVFVPLEVPENVPLCVDKVQSPRFVRAVAAFATSDKLLDFSILSVLRFEKFVFMVERDALIASEPLMVAIVDIRL